MRARTWLMLTLLALGGCIGPGGPQGDETATGNPSYGDAVLSALTAGEVHYHIGSDDCWAALSQFYTEKRPGGVPNGYRYITFGALYPVPFPVFLCNDISINNQTHVASAMIGWIAIPVVTDRQELNDIPGGTAYATEVFTDNDLLASALSDVGFHVINASFDHVTGIAPETSTDTTDGEGFSYKLKLGPQDLVFGESDRSAKAKFVRQAEREEENGTSFAAWDTRFRSHDMVARGHAKVQGGYLEALATEGRMAVQSGYATAKITIELGRL